MYLPLNGPYPLCSQQATGHNESPQGVSPVEKGLSLVMISPPLRARISSADSAAAFCSACPAAGPLLSSPIQVEGDPYPLRAVAVLFQPTHRDLEQTQLPVVGRPVVHTPPVAAFHHPAPHTQQ